MTETETTQHAPAAPRRRAGRMARIFALAVVPVLLVTGCKVSDVTDPIVKPIEDTFEDLFGLGDDEIATPQFEIVNGIKIQVVIRISDIAQGSLPVTVHVRCAGGTHASATVTVRDTGSVGVGETTFNPGWPAGTDCIVSQEIVQGVETVRTVVEWVDSNDVKATFEGKG